MTIHALDVGGLLRRARNSAGMTQRELARTAETSQAAVARYETGKVLPDLRTLDRLLGACGQRLCVDAVPARRTGKESATVRPVAIPEDFADAARPKAAGVTELPSHVRWSGPTRTYDLDKRSDRARVYEQVLREGTEDDVRRFVRMDDLLDLWPELILPAYVREAWDRWFQAHAGRVQC